MSLFAKLKNPLFKEAFLYGLTNALFSGLPLLLMPFLVAIMKPEDYGIVDLYRSLSMVLVAVLGFSTVQSITRFYYDLNEDQFKVFTSSIIIFHFFAAAIALLSLSVLDFFIDSYIVNLLYLCVIYFLFNQISEALLSIYRVEKRVKNYLYVRVSMVLLDIGLLTFLYFLFTTYSWTYRVLPNVLSAIIIGGTSLFLLRKQFDIKLKFNKELLKQSLVYSFPLIFHMIGGYILNIGDRFFITHYLGPAQLGTYSVAYQIGLAVSFFYTSFNLAWTPTFFEWMKADKLESIKKVKRLIFILMPILGLIILIIWITLSNFIDNLKNYNVDFELIVIIMIAYIFSSYYKFNANYYFYYKQTKTLATITILTSIICIIGYMVLIPAYGLMGAAVSTLITFIIMYICTFSFRPNNKNIIESTEKYE